MHVKNSAGPTGPTLGYAITEAGLKWTGVSELTAARLLARDTKESDQSPPRERAKLFLRELLKDGPRSTKEVQAASLRVGISANALADARRDLGVQSAPRGRQGARGAEGWMLSMPPSESGPLSETT